MNLQEQLTHIQGKTGFYYKNLVTEETICYHEYEAFQAASVIKIPIMIELFRRFEVGTLSKTDTLKVRAE